MVPDKASVRINRAALDAHFANDALTIEAANIKFEDPYTKGTGKLELKVVGDGGEARGKIAIDAPVEVAELTLDGYTEVASGQSVNVLGNLSTSDTLKLKHGNAGYSQLRFTGSYSGSNLVTIEQVITGTGWHNIANPFQNQTANSFGAVGADRHPNAENLRQWNADAPYIWETITDGNQPLDPGRGYIGYFGLHPQGFEGGLDLGNGPWKLSITGVPTTSAAPQLYHNKKAAGTTWEGFVDPSETDGWNLVANPFTAVLDFSSVTRPANTHNAFYIWDPNKSGGAGYINWSGAGITDPYIAPLQSYWVQTTPDFDNNLGASNQWNMSMANNSSVVTSSKPGFLKTNTTDFDRIVLRAKRTGSAEWADHAVVALIDETTDGYDADWDARKWMNPGNAMNLYSVSGAARMANNAVSLPRNSNVHKSVLMGFSCALPGVYEIAFDDNWMLNGMYLQLEDLHTGRFHNLNNGGSYVFEHDPSITNRFVLHMGYRAMDLSGGSAPINCWLSAGMLHIQSLQYDGEVSVFVNDMLGRDVWQQRAVNITPGANIQLPIGADLAKGTYLVNVVASGKVYSFKYVH